MDIVDIIRKKKEGETLTDEEINHFVQGVVSKQISGAQIGALLMAILLKGMSHHETVALTQAMTHSGTTMNWRFITVDKHSTGGVGDKVSIPLVPALAAIGLHVPMISGRGLDFTGGTLDKLESIPGFKANLTEEKMMDCMQKCGCFIAATCDSLCPADKVLYAIRDVTSTVNSVPLIIGSILSKKAASGSKYLVIDLKVGNATFFKHVSEAKAVGQKLVDISKDLGIKTKIYLTRMDEPLGRCIGNALEIRESIEIMKGIGQPDVQELVYTFGAELLFMSKCVTSVEEGKKWMSDTILNKKAIYYFEKMLISQGVDPTTAQKLCESPTSVLKPSNLRTEFYCEKSGYILSIDALKLAKVCRNLGGGRKRPNERIDYSVGIEVPKKKGSYLEEGDNWIIIHHNRPLNLDDRRIIKESLILSEEAVSEDGIIIDTIG